ncbi:flagellar hook-associated protein FlgK [Hyphomonas johnsonii]|uniref:Flagellar hook-associated protein 1 n=1 Tax=Hyphomonas johnsonii MHS-2 TaxID=1280950 RepID=A0A059FNW5_9PROT|nr:flagellar hook-associated protein FlgK [Hyphomonas johnsonii]KCZ92216.1 flagellar hook-associated protein FlgK [Hyphomonas johnsonii MHS-2]
MTLSSAIHTARSGLQIADLRADIVAANVANASTPGYVSRSVLLAENVLAGNSAGVRSVGIGRSQNDAITNERRSLTSDLAQADMLTSTWRTISARVGNSAEGNGLFKTFADFESSLSSLALSPESSTDASAVLNAAKSIVNEFHGLSQLASDLRYAADQEIVRGRDVVNSALKGIEAINGRIASINRTSSEAAGLIDERQRLLDTISEYLPVQAVPRESGTIDVMTPEGVFLLAGKARQVEFNPSYAFGPNESIASGTLSGLSVDGIDLTPGSSSYGAVSSGLFGALFTLRDQDIPNFSAQLDTLAGDLVSRLSNDSIDPTKTPGDPGIFVDPDVTNPPGLAGRIAINAAIDPAQGGATWRLRDGLGAATQGLASDSTILDGMYNAITSVRPVNASGIQGAFSSTGMVAQFASLAGQQRVNNESVLSSTSTQHTMLLDAEQEASGVDIDAQMQDLLLIEQSYAANARVIEVASQMIDRLMEI